MKFWLLENDSIDNDIKYKEIDFPDITEEIFENNQHDIILDNYLQNANLDSFSSHFFFDNDRVMYDDDDETLEIDSSELVANVDNDANIYQRSVQDEAIGLLSEASQYVTDPILKGRIETFFGN